MYIGLSSNILLTEDKYLGSVKRSYINYDYIRVLEMAGAPCAILPLGDVKYIDSLLDSCSGLLMIGGADINPLHYGEEPLSCMGSFSNELDKYQKELVGKAIEKDIPMLCICRGMQILNVSLGGTLYQDINSVSANHIQHSQKGIGSDYSHSVCIYDNTLLKEILIESNVLVNSFHHQAVNKLGNGLKVCAESVDGIIEAVEYPGKKFILGLQWHPEMMAIKNDSDMFKIFKRFVTESGF